MADVVIAQRDLFVQAPLDSPVVFKNLGRFENLTFYGTGTLLVEASSDDGVNWVDITAAGTAITGLIIFKGVSFKWYRVTGSSFIRVSAN